MRVYLLDGPVWVDDQDVAFCACDPTGRQLSAIIAWMHMLATLDQKDGALLRLYTLEMSSRQIHEH